MKEKLEAHRIEVVVGFLSIAICIYFFAPTMLQSVKDNSNVKVGPNERVFAPVAVGPGTIYERSSHQPMFTGETQRDAVKTRVAYIRSLLTGLDIDPMNTPIHEIEKVLLDLWEQKIVEPIMIFRSMDTADLSGLDLQGLDIRGMSFRRCIFYGADLSGVQLEGSVFRSSNMHKINLSDVDLRAAKLRWPINEGIFQGANFEGGKVGRCKGCDFTNANLKDAEINILGDFETIFTGADLRGATLKTDDDAAKLLRDTSGNLPRIDPIVTCYQRIQFDESTQTEGLRFVDNVDITAPFVVWALARGAILDDVS